MLDIGVPQMTGGPPVSGAEECRCPPGYSGLSCESCALGFYRDWRDTSLNGRGRCVRCPCNGKEDSCSLQANGAVECSCKVGYTGDQCQQPGKYAFLACRCLLYTACCMPCFSLQVAR